MAQFKEWIKQFPEQAGKRIKQFVVQTGIYIFFISILLATQIRLVKRYNRYSELEIRLVLGFLAGIILSFITIKLVEKICRNFNKDYEIYLSKLSIALSPGIFFIFGATNKTFRIAGVISCAICASYIWIKTFRAIVKFTIYSFVRFIRYLDDITLKVYRYFENSKIKEIPVMLLFLYLMYLCVIFHDRDHIMLDYTITFDHWWYFYHRLREGYIAQWNPFYLLGKIAVQWNYIPVSIFSPFLILSDLSLESFHFYQIISTFMSFSVIYLFGRLLGYGRIYPLLPIVLLGASGYRYWSSFLHFSTFLFFYPLAIVFLLSALYKKDNSTIIKWLLFWISLSLSFTGLRLEKITYGLFFIILIFLVFGIYQSGNWKKMVSFWGLGIITIVVTIASNAWQLSFLVNTTLENARLVGGAGFQKVFDPLFLKWVLISIVYQPALVLICLNLTLMFICYLRPHVYSKYISLITVFIVTGLELILYKLILMIRSAIGIQGFIISNIKHIDIVFSWVGILSVVFLVWVYFIAEIKRRTFGNLLYFMAVVFAGFYVAEYSWHIWPVNQNQNSFFMPFIFASFIPFGTVGLLMNKKTWIISVLVIYHFIGETGAFFLFEIVGMPWLVPRAALMEVPFQVVLMIEAVIYFTYGIALIVGKLYNKADFSIIETKVNLVAKLACVIFVFLSIKTILLPTAVKPGDFREIIKDTYIKNASFESWIPSSEKDNFSPEYFDYHQDGYGGSVEKNLSDEGIKDGMVSALLKRSSSGNSLIRYTVTDIKDIENYYIELSVWVKSKNSKPGAITIDIQDDTGFVITGESYKNSGKWEHHNLKKKIDKKTKYLFITFNIQYTATQDVYFDDITLKILTAKAFSKVYLDDFPFAGHRIDEERSIRNKRIYEAYESSMSVRSKYAGSQGLLHRIHVDDSIISFSPEMFYKFMPAYSQTLNTAPVYSSEIPLFLKNIFSDTPGKEEKRLLMPHPEMSPLFFAYKRHGWQQEGMDIDNYPGTVVILPHKDNNIVFREIMAEEGSNTPRVFLTKKVIKFNSYVDEYKYLNDILAKGYFLTDQITTSDNKFYSELQDVNSKVPLKYNVDFKKDLPEHIVLHVDSNGSAYLSLMDLWSRGWRAYIDGKETKIYRGYIGTRFIKIGSGQHIVEFKYNVPGFLTSAIVSVVIWMSMLLSVVVIVIRRYF